MVSEYQVLNLVNPIWPEGKQWKAKTVPNKNPALRTSFSKRIQKNRQLEATKALERQLNEERKQAETVIPSLPKIND